MTDFLDIANLEVKITDSPASITFTRSSFVIGLIFWGNMIDNVINPKTILLICETSIAASYLLMGYIIYAAVTPGVTTND